MWNLSSHDVNNKKNKSDICSINGGLAFLVALLKQKSTAVVENGGGILRNVSGYVATSPDSNKHREILRRNGCLQLLLHQLKSSSLTIVSNSCGTLWNLSARCPEDQQMLWSLGAVPMLQSLTNSKHKTISTCSAAALKNLFGAHPVGMQENVNKSASNGIPSLEARRKKNMVKGLSNQILSAPNEPVYEGESDDKTDDNTDDEIGDHVQAEQKFGVPNQRLMFAENMIENQACSGNSITTSYQTTESTSVEDEDIEDKPKDYSLQYEEADDIDENLDDPNAGHNNDLGVENVEAVSYFTEGTPFDTPHGISNTCSVTDLNKTGNSSASGLETPEDMPQQYTGCFSRTDSIEDLVDHHDHNEEASKESNDKIHSENATTPDMNETQIEQHHIQGNYIRSGSFND